MILTGEREIRSVSGRLSDNLGDIYFRSPSSVRVKRKKKRSKIGDEARRNFRASFLLSVHARWYGLQK